MAVQSHREFSECDNEKPLHWEKEDESGKKARHGCDDEVSQEEKEPSTKTDAEDEEVPSPKDADEVLDA